MVWKRGIFVLFRFETWVDGPPSFKSFLIGHVKVRVYLVHALSTEQDGHFTPRPGNEVRKSPVSDNSTNLPVMDGEPTHGTNKLVISPGISQCNSLNKFNIRM